MPKINSLYLMTVDWTQRANAASAVYRARKALGLDATQGAAFALVQRCYNNGEGYKAVVIGNATSEGVLALAKQALDDAPLTYAVNPTPEEVFAGEATENVTTLRAVEDPVPPTVETAGTSSRDEVFEPDIYETAMLLITAMRGNPFGALSVAGGLAKTTRSDSFKRVQKCILKVFPAESPQAMALVSQVLEDE